MAYNPAAWAEHRRWRSMRHDWKRWVTPALAKAMERVGPRARTHAAQRERVAEEAAAALRAEQEEILWLRSEIAALKFRIALRHLGRKYSPNQPRVPAGNPDGGRWTDGQFSATPRRIRLAGPLPTNDTPEVPEKRPPTIQERNRIAKAVVRSVVRYGSPIGKFMQAAMWLEEHRAKMLAYFDPPKSLDDLRSAVSNGEAGYQITILSSRGQLGKTVFPMD